MERRIGELEGKLNEAQIHVLAAYVWGLSNKVQAKP